MSKNPPVNKIVLTEFQESFIRDNFLKMTAKELSERVGLAQTSTRTFAYAMGLKKMELQYWSATQIRFLRLYYRYVGDTEIAEVFTRHFPKAKGWTKKHIEKKRRYLGLKRTDFMLQNIQDRNVKLGRFAICPINAWITRGGAKENLSTVIWNHNGIEMAFVKVDGKFIPRNRWLWQQKHGKLANGLVVRAKINAPLICELEHLEVISRTENALKNQLTDSAIIKRKLKIRDPEQIKLIALEYPEMIEMYRNITKLNRKINERT